MKDPCSELLTGDVSKRIICTPSPAAKKAFFYVQETGMLKKSYMSGTHRNNLDSFLFVCVADGKGELRYNHEVYPLKKGDCFFIDCKSPYDCKSSETEPLEILWLHFNGATSRQYYEIFTSHSKNVFRPAEFEKISDIISEIIHFTEQKSLNAEAITSELIVQLLTISLTSESGGEHIDSALNQKLAFVNTYIEEHFTEDLSLEKIASEFRISKYYLSREYKKNYGKTIFQHIIACRINYGKKLLRFSNNSVEEIAHLCGFNDQSYFVRQFKKLENVTCFAYRKMWRE